MGKPAEAIREFTRALGTLRIRAKPRHLSDDISALRRVFQDDGNFAAALRSVTVQLPKLGTYEAKALQYDLDGWSRIRFSSAINCEADLRIIFRRTTTGVELRAFGHRHEPESVYLRATER